MSLFYLAWIISVVATVGSLVFSEILKFPPCVLCWYQRIILYPLVLIIAVGILRKDKNLPYYVLPLSITGMAVASYHNLLYYSIIPENIAPCTLGISCISKFIEWFGFVSIPLLSLLSFAVITLIMILSRKSK
ncbi:2-oxoglutarate dehydrogenase [Candidatus Daviesbacteria bacterium RIFCSPLOWO2_02_FULL_40_8]|uniref:2-oxoglutarate dehydrogenase n=1 Tax=Candidatus Daviesbacteria bacterium RIFCSPLOWO2_01_FULL_40_24 TaxID=1797787 RepID=A0A1F5MJP7_9BACT|nr:MAG: 2-oxoglutarate dehydrogenase [Candidatus Daviesbacteria bacterium RIFCSPHIGHO2_01_FULL_41_45]OGE35513.1 MAG: 2-oxoglutarate dehydrogenase [Candidatus Daviesbacteria bacterium RIFCSPHIGHO2_02_FULL_41_14]OGE65604.1 MAG: 2-oxoglutarate dehydrogenase [Candidatus Daviesbacteria bacterium RIFCSPLOWO2_01_FULL_40_24]OGE67030.1 MAG: 2-oxoglutarate dehydrogenase [Candidatus Daviesbacteria bacterium RIFCSPLOWO2_02_FULL_40_8]